MSFSNSTRYRNRKKLWGLSLCRQLQVGSICPAGMMYVQIPAGMICVKEKGDTQMTRHESLHGTGSKRKIRMVSWRFLLELSSGWQPRPDGERFWTHSKSCSWLRVKGELRALKSSHLTGFSSHCSWVSCRNLSAASGADLPGVPHSSQFWRRAGACNSWPPDSVCASLKSSVVSHLSPFPLTEHLQSHLRSEHHPLQQQSLKPVCCKETL